MRLFVSFALLVALGCKNDSASSPPASGTAVESPPSGSAAQSAPGSPHAVSPDAVSPDAVSPDAVSPHATSNDSPTPTPTAPRTLERLEGGRVALGPFTMQVSPDWTEKPSTSSMRAAQFQLPSAGEGEAELIVYYFGNSGAGSVQDNVDRWLSQFEQPDGKPSASVAQVEKAQFGGQDASIVSVSGRYVAPAMPGGQAVDKPDQALLAAIVNSPQGPYYFRLIGGRSAVDASAARFREALSSLKLR
jgi:hypothetical protein